MSSCRCLQQVLQLAHVGLHRVGEIGELERQEVGVGQPDDGRARRSAQRAAVQEAGVENCV